MTSPECPDCRRCGRTIRSARAHARRPSLMLQKTTRIVPAGRERRFVSLWLVAVAALIIATLLVGGATRLTESGLSIVEWKPVTGTLPPLSQDGVAGRIREIQSHPAISRTQSRDEPRAIQDDLLVGMGPPLARPHDRCGVPAAVSLFSLARLDRTALAHAALGDLRARRGAGRQSAGGWCRRD